MSGPGFADAVAGTPAVDPTAADMGALVSGESYLISDGDRELSVLYRSLHDHQLG